MAAGWRRLRMGLATLMGWPQGFFAPYRYAATVRPPEGYPELEPFFAAMQGAGPAGGRPDWLPPDMIGAVERLAAPLAAVEGPPPEPRWRQSWFPRLDAAAAYAMVLMSGAERIVEVGSGHSTRFLARAARDLGARRAVPIEGEPGRAAPPAITCIDPAPRAALAGLGVDWRREVLGPQHLALFAALRSGDIAFFDSSHLLWPGTDVDLILNRILPVLRAGVLVHVHDIFLPDPYPADWAWRGYTEQNGLGGWIASGALRVIWSSHYALTRLKAAERPAIATLPLVPGARESSLWLLRT